MPKAKPPTRQKIIRQAEEEVEAEAQRKRSGGVEVRERDRESLHILQALTLKYGRPKTSKRAERQTNLDGKVGPYSSRFIKGVDLIAIGDGPHAGALMRTTRSGIAIEFEIEKEGEISAGRAIYRRHFNPISGAFVFMCQRIIWK